MKNHYHVRRFDQSFIFHMIRDFFLVLIIVVSVELGIRFAVALYNFEHHDKFVTQLTAEKLAADLKSIMLNAGGPVAARTVYPVLKRNHQELGVEVAIVPAPLTVTSIQKMFNFTPQGIPPQWPEGKYHEHIVSLKAEEFCLTCHVDGKIGEVLGYVAVRTYLSDKLKHWWEEVRLTSLMGMFNIIIHTIVLFLLLRFRMEPLISLHSTVSILAKGIINLSYRAKVKTHDEFGELALDLNHFLDRITQIVNELRDILKTIITVNSQLTPLSDQMIEQIDTVHQHTQEVARRTTKCSKSHPIVSKESIEVLDKILAVFEILNKDQLLNEELKLKSIQVLGNIKETIFQTQEIFDEYDHLNRDLIELSDEVHGLTKMMAKIILLEEKMTAVVKLGEALLRRLSVTDLS